MTWGRCGGQSKGHKVFWTRLGSFTYELVAIVAGLRIYTNSGQAGSLHGVGRVGLGLATGLGTGGCWEESEFVFFGNVIPGRSITLGVVPLPNFQ